MSAIKPSTIFYALAWLIFMGMLGFGSHLPPTSRWMVWVLMAVLACIGGLFQSTSGRKGPSIDPNNHIR